MLQNASANLVKKDSQGEPHVELNFLLANLSAHVVNGYYLEYQDPTQLKALQEEYRGRYLLKRTGGDILTVPLVSEEPPSDWTPCSFSFDNDWSLFERMIEHGVRQLLRTKYPSTRVPPYGRILFNVQGEANDLVKEALAAERQLLSKLGFLHIYRKYYLFAAYLQDTEAGTKHLGVAIDIGTDWQIRASIKELVEKGIDLTGCYAIPLELNRDEVGIGNKSAGCISQVDGLSVKLADYRDEEVIDARSYTVEATLENVTRCVTTVLGSSAENALRLRAYPKSSLARKQMKAQARCTIAS